MAEASEGSSGSGRAARNSRRLILREVSSEEEAHSGIPAKKPSQPTLRVKEASQKAPAQASQSKTESGVSQRAFYGAQGVQKPSTSFLSKTLLESSSSEESAPGSDMSTQQRSRAKSSGDERSLLSPEEKKQNAKERKAGKESSPPTRKTPAKATGNTPLKSIASTASTTTTTTTTATTATTAPVYKKPSSGSQDARDDSARKRAKGERIADTKLKRRSYMASSVQPDQESIAAVKEAESIFNLQSGERKSAFDATLTVIEQMNAGNRCAALVKLGPALSLFDSKDQAGYLPRLRKLASSPMPEQDRKKVIDALICSFAGSRIVYSDDNEDDNSGGEDLGTGQAYPSNDGQKLTEFQQRIAQSKLTVQGINAPGKQFSKESIQQVLNKVAVSGNTCLQLEYAILFLDALSTYHEEDQKMLVTLLLEVFGEEIVISALLLGSLSKELLQSAATKISPSVMLAGFIESDKNVVDVLTDAIAKAARAKPFLHAFTQRLLDRKAAIATPGKNNPRIAGATMYLLMDMAALSQMPEASRCALITNLYFNDAKNLHDALSRARKQDGETGFDLAHRVIASLIDVSACSVLLADSTSNHMEHLASYQDRVDAASGKKSQPRLQPRGKHLRELLLDANGSVAAVKQAIAKILASNADFEAKRVQLQALDSAPLTDNLPDYVEKYYFNAAHEYLNEISPGKTRSLPEEKRFRTEKKPYYQTLSLIQRKLPEETVQELRKKTREEYGKALNSTLPAVHAAIMDDDVDKLKAYLDAVLDPNNGLSSNKAMELIKMPHKGKSAFYRALIRGTPEMIRTFIETILASKLDLTHKIDLLLARRDSDNFGAFYIAMSSGDAEQVEAFIKAILESKLNSANKEKLLRCKKEVGKGIAAAENRVSPIWKSAELYARSEAVRNEETWASREQKITTFDKISYGARKMPNKVNPKIKRDPAGLHNREKMPSLVALFDKLINESTLHSSTKAQLTQ